MLETWFLFSGGERKFHQRGQLERLVKGCIKVGRAREFFQRGRQWPVGVLGNTQIFYASIQ